MEKIDNIKKWLESDLIEFKKRNGYYPFELSLIEGINPEATFQHLQSNLSVVEYIYDYLNVYDSIIREIVFEELSERMGVEYSGANLI